MFARQASTLLNKKGASMIRTMSLFGHEGFLESLFRMLGSGCAHSSWVQCLPRILKALDSTLSTEKKKQKQTNPCIVLLKISVLPSERKEGQEYCVCVWLRRRRHKGPEMFLFTHLLACYRFLDKPLC